jgi:hypothetical protein
MKRILQAMDSVSTSPVVGADSMAKFLSIVDNNPTVQVLQEGKDSHKVSLPVQMAMQHYQNKQEPIVRQARVGNDSVVGKYFHDVEQEHKDQFEEQQTQKRQLIKQYAGVIAERVMMREGQPDSIEKIAKRKALQVIDSSLYHNKKKHQSKSFAENGIPGHSVRSNGSVVPGIQSAVAEAPLDFDKENPMASTIHSHKGVNPASVEARIMRARGQLRELAAKAESSELIVWESIARHFPELAMNIEQIQHGIAELAKIRKGGGRRVHNIDRHIGETNAIKEANAKKRTLKNSNPCWDNYKPVGTKKKGGRTVPNCVPKE